MKCVCLLVGLVLTSNQLITELFPDCANKTVIKEFKDRDRW